MSGLVAVSGLGLGGLLTVAFLVGVRTRPSMLLVRVEHQIAELRVELNGYRVAHEHLMTSLDRRLDGLEQTAAHAANELRMASDQAIARLVEHASPNGERT